jgi:hypothetical protein
VESFKNWGSHLVHAEASADDDGDGTDNLMEYALGGNPAVSSSQVAGLSMPMLPVPLGTESVSGDSREVMQYVRRADAATRLLAYHLEVSTSLDTWSEVNASAEERQVTPLGAGLECVEVALPPHGGSRRFVRLRVTLAE